MERKVFYSWQSDLPNSTNRGFIQRALEDAAKRIASDDSIAVEPVIERDTKGIPGSPDIANAIFDKISNADIFLADISIINDGQSGRLMPNPNVLLELGYALRLHGYERIILVFNEVYGDVTKLPFDLRMRRCITYSAKEEDEDRSGERKKLSSTIEEAIRLALASEKNSIGSYANIPDQIDSNADWFETNRTAARKGLESIGFSASMEVQVFLQITGFEKKSVELRDAAKKSEIHTFGMPVAIFHGVLPDSEGIHAEISHNGLDIDKTYNYWAIRKNGALYILESLFEDVRRPNEIFFNTRIVRITEVFMYLANVYKNLSIDIDESIVVRITHSGLKGRKLSAAGAGRSLFYERFSGEDVSSIEITTSIRKMENELFLQVREICGPLFELFDFLKFEDSVIQDIVEKFKEGKVT